MPIPRCDQSWAPGLGIFQAISPAHLALAFLAKPAIMQYFYVDRRSAGRAPFLTPSRYSFFACSISVFASLTSNLPGASRLSDITTPSFTSIE